ncbi:C-C motif chemokine 27 [Mixophyes fleayi]|uniref:C-C motif chemokine 27 n=1 Tax=Mixophyes fleayi TaxID=3061075 RepID=UPI003F4DB2BC
MSALKIFILLVFIAIITSPCQGLPTYSISCCTRLAKRIPKNMLKHVTKVRSQKKDGICSLRAIVLYVENKQRCMDPKNKVLQLWLKENKHL